MFTKQDLARIIIENTEEYKDLSCGGAKYLTKEGAKYLNQFTECNTCLGLALKQLGMLDHEIDDTIEGVIGISVFRAKPDFSEAYTTKPSVLHIVGDDGNTRMLTLKDLFSILPDEDEV